MIQEAIEYAYMKHTGQFRKDSNTPYVVHPIDVMHRIYSYGVSSQIILAGAVLHDTIEDTDATEADIRIKFGNEVASLVAELTKPYERGSIKQKHQWLKDLAQNASSEAIIIKYADRMSNIEDFYLDNNKNWKKYAKAASPIYNRIFHDDKIVEIAPNIIRIANRELSEKGLI